MARLFPFLQVSASIAMYSKHTPFDAGASFLRDHQERRLLDVDRHESQPADKFKSQIWLKIFSQPQRQLRFCQQLKLKGKEKTSPTLCGIVTVDCINKIFFTQFLDRLVLTDDE